MRLNTFLPRSWEVATKATAVRLVKPGEEYIRVSATARFPVQGAMFLDGVYDYDMDDTWWKGKGAVGRGVVEEY